METIKTNRLILRPWKEEDLPLFAKLNADPRVMEYFPSVRTLEESRGEYERIVAHFQPRGWGLWAVSVQNGADFIGFIGLRYEDFPAPFTPTVEVGWRLAFDQWGKGYATEGALASLSYGFSVLNLKEIVSFTPLQNIRSQRVMEKIGLKHDPKDDFDHPKLPVGHHLKRHALYRLNRSEWERRES